MARTSGLWAGLTELGREAARIVLPSACLVCSGELPWREREASCCASCWAGLPLLPASRCSRCALPFGNDELGLIVCFDCRARRQPLEWIDSWGIYEEGIENLLHALKFGNQHFLAEPLGLRMSAVVAAREDLDFNLVIPVPMHRRKLRKRGYNQAELLAGEVSDNLALTLGRNLLIKSRDTEAQAHLPRQERRRNLRAAFEASHDVAGKAVLLIDDVCTTGETLRACARALRRRKASRVCAVTFARAL